MIFIRHKANKQNGNALFLILIAVALFAALSYAITQSSRGGGSIDREQAEIETSQVLQYLSSIQQAVQRVMAINGCTEEDISFEHTGFHGTSWAHTPITRNECKIFHADGGGISSIPPIDNYDIAPVSSLCYEDNPQIALRNNFFKGIGDDDTADLAISICQIPQYVCDAVYRLEEIPAGPSADSMQVDNSSGSGDAFRGSYTTTRTAVNSIGFHSDSAGLDGKQLGCWEPASGTNKLYMILIAR